MADLTRYAFDTRTGVYVGPAELHPDPLNPGQFLEPWGTTALAPPAAPAGEAAVFANGAWSLVADHRGEVWFKGTDPLLVDFLGDPAAQDLTKAPVLPALPPPSSCTRLGLMRAFKARGLWETVKEMIAANADLQEEWDLAVEIRKSDPLILTALGALTQVGIAFSDADVDKLIADAVAAVA
ncbi:MAG: hypothetical protein INR70_02130 [Parafilimonas terrae]|nr:hypothetical protein [Parafilimonas terrae]